MHLYIVEGKVYSITYTFRKESLRLELDTYNCIDFSYGTNSFLADKIFVSLQFAMQSDEVWRYLCTLSDP